MRVEHGLRTRFQDVRILKTRPKAGFHLTPARLGRMPGNRGYALPGDLAAHISVTRETAIGSPRLGEDMKHDPYYKYLAAVIITGVLISKTGSYTPPFVLAAALIAIGPLAFWLIVREVQESE